MANVIISRGRKTDEHDLGSYALFQEYLQLYERTIEQFLQETGCTVEQFYQEIRNVQENTENPQDLHFIDCLLTSADYESFSRVMIREAKRQAFARVSINMFLIYLATN